MDRFCSRGWICPLARHYFDSFEEQLSFSVRVIKSIHLTYFKSMFQFSTSWKPGNNIRTFFFFLSFGGVEKNGTLAQIRFMSYYVI